MKIGIIVGSTRPGRLGIQVAEWVNQIAQQRSDAEFQLVDVADYGLPILDEPVPPAMGQYSKDHTKQWAEKIGSFDAFVFVAPEYNHGISGGLKNAIDFIYQEWNNKSAGFVSYGGSGGTRAIEHLRGVMAELQVADVRGQVSLSITTDFENYSVFKPNPGAAQQLEGMLDQVIAWGGALKAMREKQTTEAQAA